MDQAKAERLSELAGMNASPIQSDTHDSGSGNLSQGLNALATDLD
jgi:hypothetical protein